MLLLLFHIGDHLYAIDTDPILEIVPMVLLRKIQPAPDSLAGVFNYRGKIVPVIDLCQLIRGTPCQVCYSTRIILVNYSVLADAEPGILSNSEPATEKAHSQQPAELQPGLRQFGLIAERVAETLKISAAQLETAERVSDAPYLGELFVEERGMIQKMNWEQLIKDAERAARFAGGTDRANGAERH